MPISVRVVEPKTVDFIKAIVLQDAVLFEPYGKTVLMEIYNSDEQALYVNGYVGATLYASVKLTFCFSGLIVERIAVHSSMRNGGVCSACLRFCEQLACERGYRTLYYDARHGETELLYCNGFTRDAFWSDWLSKSF